jgi:hypothetical protein
MAIVNESYPVTLSIDYPDKNLDRMTSFFRIFTIIPIGIVLGLVAGAAATGWKAEPWLWGLGGGGILFFAVLVMLLFRQKYPKWWFDWNLNITRFSTRVGSYFLLMTDVYPSTDEEQNVHFDMQYPDAKNGLNRWMPLVKWFLAIPHFIVLYFLYIASFVITVIVWFAILFTKRYPKDLFIFNLGVYRWSLRVAGYALLLVTDKYPPFRFEE